MTSRNQAFISASCNSSWTLAARSSNRSANIQWLNPRNQPYPRNPLNLFPLNKQDDDATLRQNEVAAEGSETEGQAVPRGFSWPRPASDLPVFLGGRATGERTCARSHGTADGSGG